MKKKKILRISIDSFAPQIRCLFTLTTKHKSLPTFLHYSHYKLNTAAISVGTITIRKSLLHRCPVKGTILNTLNKNT